ncbi:SPOR domain-containing protein [Massilia sp. CMS3.1]|uniref:SPOR domain-containing protein n=1 Tax=Massilia sp. CMS3.1 TaxID=3373083 RepID=UPI003EE452EA
MGLFSIFSKNKQDSSAQDSGRFSRDDDDFGQQARAKRASHANESGQGGSRRSRSGGDPMLPEKKRARRRLVGAVALALAAAVGLPMLLDSEPRPLGGDIAIQIPSKEKAPALPVPASPVPAADSVDSDEEIIAPAPLATTTPRAAEPPPLKMLEEAPAPRVLPPPEPAPKIVKPETRPEPKVAERNPEPKAPERKVAEKPAVKKPEEKPVPRPKENESARALALLEGKSAKPAEVHPRVEDKPAASGRFVVQVAALGTQEKVDELQARLRAGGISSFTKKSGALIKVQVGPFGSREEADKTKARLGGLGLGGFLVPL